MLHELLELPQHNYDHIDFIDEPVNVGFDCPLDLHCTYTRDQLLVALDFMKPSTVRGVLNGWRQVVRCILRDAE